MRQEENAINDKIHSDRKSADAHSRRKDAAAPAGKKPGGSSRTAHTTEKRRAVKDEREVVLLALLSHEKNGTFSNVLVKKTLDDCAGMSTMEMFWLPMMIPR